MAPLFVPLYNEIFLPVAPRQPAHFEVFRLPAASMCRKRPTECPKKTDEGQLCNECPQRKAVQDFHAILPLPGFGTNDVKVTLDKEDRVLLIRAEKEEEKDGMVSYRQIHRSIPLPGNVELEQLKAQMDEEGRLTVTCPVKKAVEEQQKEEHKQVPNEEAKSLEEPQQEPPKEAEQPKQAEAQAVEVEVHVPPKEAMETEETEEPKEKEVKLDTPQMEVVEAEQKEEVQPEQEEEDPKQAEEAAENTPAGQMNNPFEFTVNVAGFQPENISVELNESASVIVVRASEEQEQEDGTIVARSITKKMNIDGNTFDLNELSSSLNDEGILTIHAPRRQNVARNIPIMSQ